MPRPSIGAGQSRVNGLEVSSANSRNPAEVAPSTPITRARSAPGRLRPNPATAPPHSARISVHSRMEPSWLPQVPVILYSSGFRLVLFSAMFSTEKSSVTALQTRQPKAVASASNWPPARPGATAISRASRRWAPQIGRIACAKASAQASASAK